VEDIPGENAEPCLWRNQTRKTNKANKGHGKANWHAEEKHGNQNDDAYDSNCDWVHFLTS